jgi:predicted ATPase
MLSGIFERLIHMQFVVIGNRSSIPDTARDTAFLWSDNWNDWWEYQTLYVLTYVDEEGEKHRIGEVKIGEFDWDAENTRPQIPRNFETLDDEFFSLGQSAEYYELLRGFGAEFCNNILMALNDVALDEALYLRASDERVMGVSVMRSVNERSVTGQFRRIIDGGAKLTAFDFSYRGPQQLDREFDPVELSFSVQPGSRPPTNIQVLIGRNGVGKSFLMNSMSRALVNSNSDVEKDGEFFEPDDFLDEGFENPFANILSVTFSAFDDFPIIKENQNALIGVRYTNIGLRALENVLYDDGTTRLEQVTREPDELAKDFISSARMCVSTERAQRWRQALTTLETDPIFEDANVGQLFEITQRREFKRAATRLFKKLSSGHKIVLLTITKLVEKVEERTLVIMDEPEAHLHPPLLAGLIRAISDLLINRNGVAIIATHSPVILQEVPRSCVWKMHRHGGGAQVERPERETFAEHVGVLTHEVFRLEVTRSGFHKMLADAIEPDDDFDDVVAKFDHEIGLEGRALISGLIAVRDAEDQDEN